MLTITYYLDVVSSWCHYVEPVWKRLQERYADAVDFRWQIALIPASGLPGSREEEEWYYRRSGMITRQTSMLNAGWWEAGMSEFLAPNAVAVAARNLGVKGDGVRLALARAAMIEGRPVGRWQESVAVAAAVSGIDAEVLQTEAQRPEVEQVIRDTTEQFYGLSVTQRPAFRLESEIGDVAVFSGLIQETVLVAAIEAMLSDTTAYRSWSAHFGASWDKRDES